MIEKKVEPLYRKIGRKYVKVSSYDAQGLDCMPVGSWQLVHCSESGGRRYYWDINPNRAAVKAAALELASELERLMLEASKPVAQYGLTKYSAKQLEAIEQAREILAKAKIGMPTCWEVASPRDIARKAISCLEDV